MSNSDFLLVVIILLIFLYINISGFKILYYAYIYKDYDICAESFTAAIVLVEIIITIMYIVVQLFGLFVSLINSLPPIIPK